MPPLFHALHPRYKPRLEPGWVHEWAAAYTHSPAGEALPLIDTGSANLPEPFEARAGSVTAS